MPQQRRRPASSSSRKAARARPARKQGELPPLVFAQASPVSVGGTSLFSGGGEIDSETLPAFLSDDRVVEAAAYRLQQAGFQVLQVSPATINIAGPPRLYEEAFGSSS